MEVCTLIKCVEGRECMSAISGNRHSRLLLLFV